MHGGCWADIHSTTHVQCPGSPCHGQNIRRGPVDVTWAVLLAARDGAIQTWALGWPPPQLLAPWGSGPCMFTSVLHSKWKEIYQGGGGGGGVGHARFC